ncbi:hypothetical protein GCM10009555_018380 [Acrocarpospora macrocephala]|uniref:HTH cro/C1-type domain-containing protein n=1 Tax=Acrocarpospora macrocephala TaxID=150177 RepID=A0A5M3WMF1_9ACTN|nr:hypothetical protein [Acrocarpospora macrocephala]GES07498.1 hypothetical protein Amac_010930 [Acrocarpospora macrocephala]
MHTTEWDRDLLRDALTEIMKAANLNPTGVGELAGRDRTTAHRWLKGKNQPNVDAATRFARAIVVRHPELADLVSRFLAAAGYPEGNPPPERASALMTEGDAEREAIERLRVSATAGGKSLGEILVERGLAEPKELKISDQVRGDSVVRKIEQSPNIPDDEKNDILKDLAELRRQTFREYGIDD